MNNKKINNKKELFENTPVMKALLTMAIPTIISQLINLIYNLADTFFVGRTGNPYMIASVSLSFTLFVFTVSIANLFGIGGGGMVSRLMGVNEYSRARRVSAFSFYGALACAAIYSILIGIFMDPILRLLGASEYTIGFAKQYTLLVVVIGSIPVIMSTTMAHFLRNTGYSRQASLGLSGGGVLNIILDPLFMFVVFPDGMEVFAAALATLLSNLASFVYFIVMVKKVGKDDMETEGATSGAVGSSGAGGAAAAAASNAISTGTAAGASAGTAAGAAAGTAAGASREASGAQEASSAAPLSISLRDLSECTSSDRKEVIKVGIPSAILPGLYDAGNIVLNARMAAHGDIQLAAIGIVLKVERLPNAIGIGISQGMLPLVAYNYAAGNTKRRDDFIKTARKLGLAVTLVTTVLYEVFATQIVGVFISGGSSGEEVAMVLGFATTFLRIRALGAMLLFLNYHTSYCMQSMGDGKGTLVHSVFRQLIFYIPFLILFDMLWGENGLAAALLAGETLGAATALILLSRWMKKTEIKMSRTAE